MKQEPNHVKAAFVGGMFALITAGISGAFLIVNTLIQSGFILLGPSIQIGALAGSGQAAGELAAMREGDQPLTSGVENGRLEMAVESGQLLCLAAEEMEVENLSQALEFSGREGLGVVCWIGPQLAQASEISSSELELKELPNEQPEEAALALASAWGEQLVAGSRGCAQKRGGCDLAGVAVIRPDGAILQP